jgi:hypothetical protein
MFNYCSLILKITLIRFGPGNEPDFKHLEDLALGLFRGPELGSQGCLGD